jgi:2-polyprenyl-3-methyl-5-hydroxy-6-metoxy-1,4-benzoquinol methylase
MFHLNKKYPYEIEVNNVALKLINNFLMNNSSQLKILDVGCGYGMLLSELSTKYKNIDLFGIEKSKEAIKKIPSFVHLFTADIEDHDDVLNKLNKEKFDLIIFSDVLEHLYDPVNTLNFYSKFIKKNGAIVVTVPNIGNIYSRISLFFGFFNYSETGVMDKTHIRFFTKKTLSKLAISANLKIIKSDYDSIIIRWFVPTIKYFFKGHSMKASSKLIDSNFYKFYFKFIRPVEEVFSSIIPTLFAFRLGVLLKKE